jgi:hypothetical protein
MYQPHWSIVDNAAERAGHNNRSAALRLIVERYDRVGCPVQNILTAMEDDVISPKQALTQLEQLVNELVWDRMETADDCARE